MDAKELEALSMLSRGFVDLKDANPELAYTLVLDILSGINECAVSFHRHESFAENFLATKLSVSIYLRLVGFSRIVGYSEIPKSRQKALLL